MQEIKALLFYERFSVLTVGENKVPNFKWGDYQNERMPKEQFLSRLKDPSTKSIGVITGFDFLECVDVDLKVFSTTIEMQEFWDEYLQTLKDNIYDFDNKFVLYKTKSGGYHILYKSKRVQGNTKIAKLKGHNEAIIESRGRGGYIFVYPENKVGERSYFDIDFVTDEDRETLWNVSRAYNYIEQKEEEVKPKEKKEYTGITPWEDFNNQTNIVDVVTPDDFFIPPRGNKNKHILIKRHGSTAPHSGYIFKDSGCMYLFSTGTIYPHEKLISPFAAYAYKYHNGDFGAAVKDLYEQGFGERVKSKIDELKPVIVEKPQVIETEFPIDIFHEDIQYYINECATKLDMNRDYMGCSLLWLISVVAGNHFNIEVKRGWIENGVIWLALVGRAGVGKTPSIDKVIFPLSKLNNKEIKRYIEDYQRWQEYEKLNKKEKQDYAEVPIPRKTQFIVNDITIEALVDMHQESDNAVGVFKDELAGWIKDMNKYRAGSDLEFWLSSWSGKPVNLNRKTAKSSFVDKPFIPVLGGIQPSIFNSLATEENKDNGFLDRLLLSYPEVTINGYNENELDYTTITWFNEIITRFYKGVIADIKRNEDGEIQPVVLKLTPEAKKEWVRIFNNITENQNNEEENEYLKSMYPKQKTYVPRFAMLIHIFKSFFNEYQGIYEVDADSILKAEKLSNYFVNNARKVKIDSAETKEIKTTMNQGKTTAEKVAYIYQQDPDFNRSKVAELLGVSRQQVYNIIKQINNESNS
jgi:hypothetical protein